MNRVHRQREIITRDAYNVKVLHVHTCKTFRVTMSTRLTSLLAHISVGPQNSSVHVIKNRTRWIIHYREYFVVEVSRHRRKIVRVKSLFRNFDISMFLASNIPRFLFSLWSKRSLQITRYTLSRNEKIRIKISESRNVDIDTLTHVGALLVLGFSEVKNDRKLSDEKWDVVVRKKWYVETIHRVSSICEREYTIVRKL